MTLEAEVMIQKSEGSDEQGAVEFIRQENRESEPCPWYWEVGSG